MEPGLTEEDAKVQFLSDMAHEVGHYTQFRDGKELTEVGIEDITDDLLNGYCRTYSEANV
jgi:glutathionylspermidine synthase